MTREEEIDILSTHYEPDDQRLEQALDMAIEALKAPKWIPCKERLPRKEKKTYWVCTDTGYQCECRWTDNRFGIGEGEWGWSIFDTPQYSKPIAWMPLPKPYKGGEA